MWKTLDTAIDEFDITATELDANPTVPLTFGIYTIERVRVRMGPDGSEENADLPRRGKSARDVDEVALEGFGLAKDILQRAKPEAPQGQQRQSKIFSQKDQPLKLTEEDDEEDDAGEEEESEEESEEFGGSSYDSGTEIFDGGDDDVADEDDFSED